jgi:hypothetical protein
MQEREQRLTMRILATWRTLCRGSLAPRRAQIDPILFGRDWPHCVLVDLDPHLEASRLSYVGSKLCDPSWPPLERQPLSECGDGTLLQAMLLTAPRVIAKGLPISTGGVVTHDGDTVLYRSIVLPLAETNGRIDGLLAAASFRVIAVTEEIHSFQGQDTLSDIEIVEAVE